MIRYKDMKSILGKYKQHVHKSAGGRCKLYPSGCDNYPSSCDNYPKASDNYPKGSDKVFVDIHGFLCAFGRNLTLGNKERSVVYKN